MTAESVVLLILLAATLASAAMAALILAAFHAVGWVVIAALICVGLLVWRMIADHLAARVRLAQEDLADDWRVG